MAIDMSQFYQVFFEEAAEHLASMESLLVSMDPAAPDTEELNALFRAAHSIKGSSATFGFGDMAEVTHVMETLLDGVRKGERRLTAAMIDACLAAGDVLRTQLAAHMGEAQADEAAAGAVRQRLEALCAGSHEAEALPSAGATESCYRIEFVPDAASAAKPELLDNLLEELGGMGRLLRVLRGGSEGASPWCIHIESRCSADDLCGVIEFMAAPGSARVAPSSREEALGESPAVAEEAYGLFDVESPQDAPEPYGFFDDPPAIAASASGEGEAYGFFVELPAQPAPAAADEVACDGSYGLFAAPVATTTEVPAEPRLPAVTAPRSVDAPAGRKAGNGRSGGDSSSIRVSVEKVDQMINLVGELVITQAMLTQSAEGLDPVLYERLMSGLAQLERNTRDLQESVMSIRMLPISVVFSRFPRVVRDVSQKLGKQVELKTMGENTELDKGLIERISDPLTHLIRNSLDHGIESPEVRRAAGKPEHGTITLKACHQSGNIVIEVGDDGAGLNRQKILAKARERGLEASESMSDAEVWLLIFEPGFSTADQVTDVSGRGVGMDVVKRNISAMGGRVDIESVAGVGTRMTVRLPLTLAILDGMSVCIGGETYIIPLGYVVESLQPKPGMMRSVSGVDRLIQVRGDYLSVIDAGEFFGAKASSSGWTEGIMVILEADGAKAALFVDQLLGQHQVVIKSLEANYRRVAGISGATIMGDGRVALILDASALVSKARRALPAAA